MSNLVKKLFIKPGYRVALVDVPKAVTALLAPLPEGATLSSSPGKPPYDVLLGCARWQKDVATLAKQAQHTVAEGGAFWLVYPKLSAGEESDLSRDVLHALAANAGWDGVSLVAADGTWSAMRFKRLEAAKPKKARK